MASWNQYGRYRRKQKPQPKPKLMLLEAVDSLYKDRMEPMDNRVIRRIEELYHVRWSFHFLKDLATSMQSLSIREDIPRAKFWIYKKGKKDDFLDAVSCGSALQQNDTLWDELRKFINDWDSLKYPCTSCYSFACFAHEHYPAFDCFSLGEVYQIVNLAIKEKRLLGYRDGWVVPYHESLEFEKHVDVDILCSSQLEGVATWDTICGQLRKLLADYDGSLPLSAVKSRFNQRFGLKLKETALGYAKMSELVQDERFHRIFYMSHGGNERWLVLNTFKDKQAQLCDAKAAKKELWAARNKRAQVCDAKAANKEVWAAISDEEPRNSSDNDSWRVLNKSRKKPAQVCDAKPAKEEVWAAVSDEDTHNSTENKFLSESLVSDRVDSSVSPLSFSQCPIKVKSTFVHYPSSGQFELRRARSEPPEGRMSQFEQILNPVYHI